MLNWNQLLCEERRRPRSGQAEGNGPYNTRNEFEIDYDRIVGSSSVRRLQDKAQVFPLQKNDFVRTRLTHSIEVSAIARSMAKTVGKLLERDKIFTREQTEKFMGMLQTAGLIHDLGNPPFGHYGEKIIQNWYREIILGEKKRKDKYYKETQEDMDFIHFDGNVQNLRIVTKLQTLNDQYGMNLTYGTLATIIKYPFSSKNSTHDKNKFGYFKSEEQIIQEIWKNTGLKEGVRHPATFLLEAADDIAYICDDIEDGVKKGYIPWNEEYKKLKDIFSEDDKYDEIFKKIDNISLTQDMEKEKSIAHVRFFRNEVQGYLIKSAVKCFQDKYDQIMEGKYGLNDLLENDKKLVKELKGITTKYCYDCDEVLALELVGDRVIKELLNTFYTVIKNSNNNTLNDISTYEGKIYHIISNNYKYIARFDYESNEYQKIHLITDFVSGMTDSYAVLLYKKLLGISLPE